jgi:hypothetical protein
MITRVFVRVPSAFRVEVWLEGKEDDPIVFDFGGPGNTVMNWAWDIPVPESEKVRFTTGDEEVDKQLLKSYANGDYITPSAENRARMDVLTQAVFDLYMEDFTNLRSEVRELKERMDKRDDLLLSTGEFDFNIAQFRDLALTNLENNNTEIQRLQVDVGLIRQAIRDGSIAIQEGLRMTRKS